jgi:membrane protease YdiL (CAAX protease family)
MTFFMQPRSQRDSVATFYLLALGISWAGWISFAGAQAGLLPFSVPWEIPLLAQFGPTVAAFVLAGLHEGPSGIRRLGGLALRWRQRPHWYAVALLTTPAIALVSLGVHALLGESVPGWAAFAQWHVPYAESFGSGGVYALDKAPHPSLGPIALLRRLIAQSPWLALGNFIVFSLVTGPVSEEFGWRGWLLPRLQQKWSALKASMVVGLLWGFWHTGPDFWRIVFTGDPAALLYPLAMTIGTLPLSILFCWLFNSTRSSLLPPMLFHASFNATLSMVSLVWSERSSLLIGAELVLGLWIVAGIVLAVYGPSRLSRDPAFASYSDRPATMRR